MRITSKAARRLAVLALSTATAAPANAQSVSGAAGEGYATSAIKNDLTLEQLKAMPREVSPFTVPLKAQLARFFSGKKRIYVPSYALMITRAGEASAYAGGALSRNAGRRTTIQTTLAGVPDELGAQLATEAHADLVARLKAAGYEVLAAPPADAPAPIGPTTKSPTGQTVYGPAGAPLVPGLPWVNSNVGAFNKVVGRGSTNGDDLIVLLPGLGIDYERMQSSGTSNYGGHADVGARLRFHVMEQSGAFFSLHSPQPYNSAWSGNFYVEKGAGTDEPFAVLTQTGDKSDSKALHVGLALVGLGSTYKQKKIYEAEADPDRFAALTRAAFKGMNMSLVEQLKESSARE